MPSQSLSVSRSFNAILTLTFIKAAQLKGDTDVKEISGRLVKRKWKHRYRASGSLAMKGRKQAKVVRKATYKSFQD